MFPKAYEHYKSSVAVVGVERRVALSCKRQVERHHDRYWQQLQHALPFLFFLSTCFGSPALQSRAYLALVCALSTIVHPICAPRQSHLNFP